MAADELGDCIAEICVGLDVVQFAGLNEGSHAGPIPAASVAAGESTTIWVEPTSTVLLAFGAY